MSEIVMPKLSDTMTEGRLVSWKKQVGDTVRRGEVLAEVETDKANMELESFTEGVLLEIRVKPGELAQVGTVIAVIGQPGEKAAAPQPAEVGQGGQASQQAPPQAGAAPVQPQEEKPQPAVERKPAGEGESQAQPHAAPPAAKGEEQTPAKPAEVSAAAGAQPAAAAGAPAQVAESRERAAPVVRRRARELGIDLGQVKGSGPDGRILLQDLERPGGAPTEKGRAATSAVQAPIGEVVTPLPRLRAAVARTVSESWSTIPHFTVTMEIAMDEAESVRRQLKEAGQPVTVNDLLVKGAALALQGFPRLNASFTAEGMREHPEFNIGVAVGVPDGVLVPVIPGCQRLSLLQIAEASRGLVGRARSGSLSEQEMSGGTFSISNMGMYGVSQFSAIIHPSQAGVLAVGEVADAVVVRGGVPACARVMKVTLSADHRLVDGAYAAEFLTELKKIMESPVRLLI